MKSIVLFTALCGVSGQPLQEVTQLVDRVRSNSYPQLSDTDISLHVLHSDSVFLEARFTFPSYFFSRKLRYTIKFNPEAVKRGIPPEGLRAIVAHELAHIDYYHKTTRLGLLGLVRLLVPASNARFERSADLDAIALGYGPGLKLFRVWMYRNVPANRIAEKRRDYFSPEEIDAIVEAIRQHAEIIHTFTRCVPRNLSEIEREARNPSAACP